MKLLATLKAEDVEDNPPRFDYDSFKPRAAARAVLLDGARVALIHVSKHDYYMLPGGGIENEDITSGLAREILEEVGCGIEITEEVGSIETYMDRWGKKQTDFCFVAKKIDDVTDITHTDFEAQEGHEVVWTRDLDMAIESIERAHPSNRDGKLVRARDLLFLKIVKAR